MGFQFTDGMLLTLIGIILANLVTGISNRISLENRLTKMETHIIHILRNIGGLPEEPKK